MTVRTRTRAAVIFGGAATLAWSGCRRLPGLTVEQIPLPAPGGIGESITVRTSFDNALNLPARAKWIAVANVAPRGATKRVQSRPFQSSEGFYCLHRSLIPPPSRPSRRRSTVFLQSLLLPCK